MGFLKTLVIYLIKGGCLTIHHDRFNLKEAKKHWGEKTVLPLQNTTEHCSFRGVNRFDFNRCCVPFGVLLLREITLCDMPFMLIIYFVL